METYLTSLRSICSIFGYAVEDLHAIPVLWSNFAKLIDIDKDSSRPLLLIVSAYTCPQAGSQ